MYKRQGNPFSPPRFGVFGGIDGMLGAPRESDAYLKAKKIFDSSGLFLPTPVFAGLSPEEQRSMERMHPECLKKLPSISLQTFEGKPGEGYERWKSHFLRLIDSQPALTKSGKMTSCFKH